MHPVKQYGGTALDWYGGESEPRRNRLYALLTGQQILSRHDTVQSHAGSDWRDNMKKINPAYAPRCLVFPVLGQFANEARTHRPVRNESKVE